MAGTVVADGEVIADDVGVASGDSGAVSCGVAVAVPRGGCALGTGAAVGWGMAVGAVVADGVAGLTGPDPAQAVSQMSVRTRRAISVRCWRIRPPLKIIGRQHITVGPVARRQVGRSSTFPHGWWRLAEGTAPWQATWRRSR